MIDVEITYTLKVKREDFRLICEALAKGNPKETELAIKLLAFEAEYLSELFRGSPRLTAERILETAPEPVPEVVPEAAPPPIPQPPPEEVSPARGRSHGDVSHFFVQSGPFRGLHHRKIVQCAKCEEKLRVHEALDRNWIRPDLCRTCRQKRKCDTCGKLVHYTQARKWPLIDMCGECAAIAEPSGPSGEGEGIPPQEEGQEVQKETLVTPWGEREVTPQEEIPIPEPAPPPVRPMSNRKKKRKHIEEEPAPSPLAIEWEKKGGLLLGTDLNTKFHLTGKEALPPGQYIRLEEGVSDGNAYMVRSRKASRIEEGQTIGKFGTNSKNNWRAKRDHEHRTEKRHAG